MPDAIRHPVQFSGFRVKHGMTTRGKPRGINPQRLKEQSGKFD